MLNNNQIKIEDRLSGQNRFDLNPIGQLVEKFLFRDTLYPFSALLMMIGCYLVLKSGYTNGTSSADVLRGFLILQVYELLVLSLACVLARRLGRFSDSQMLLLIALVLMMDPTLFTTSFFSLQNAPGVWGNGMTLLGLLMFLLIPAKLSVLQYFCRFRLSRAGFAFVLSSVALIYVGLYPMSLYDAGWSQPDLYFLLVWAYAALACFVPGEGGLARIMSADPDFATEKEQTILRKALVVIPLTVPGVQLMTALWVYSIDYDPVFFAPYFIVATMLFVSFAHPRRTRALSLLADGSTVAGIFFAMWSLMLWGDSSEVPAFRESLVSFIISLCGFCGLYLSLFLRWRDWAQVVRAGFLVLLVVLTYGANQGWFDGVGWLYGLGYQFYLDRWTDLAWLVRTQTRWVFFGLWLIALVIMAKLNHRKGWAVFGGVTLLGFLHQFGIAMGMKPLDQWHLAFGYLWLMSHCFGSYAWKEGRHVLAVFMAFCGVLAMLFAPSWWRVVLVLVEFGALLVMGLLLFHAGYWTIAGLQMGLALMVLMLIGSPVLAPVLIGYALILFVLGALVSFNRPLVRDLLTLCFPGHLLPPPVPPKKTEI